MSGAGKTRINLALQGGGAHGAYTWGVLDRLLEDDQIEIAGVSGTSAGALNAAALKAGMVRDGPAGARAALAEVWEQVLRNGLGPDSEMLRWFMPLGMDAGVISQMLELSPLWQGVDMAGRVMSPYASGPFYANPLEPVVRGLDFECVCAHQGPALFISATNVRTGKIRVFEAEEVTTEVILASACLPTLFRAVSFKDPRTGVEEAFWDGGYTGNPALFPLFDKSLPDDIVIVNINPLYRAEVPRSATEIQNRINEISFNSSLLRELRAISFVHELIAKGQVAQGAMKSVLVHMIADDDLMTELGVATKTIPVTTVIERLFEAGRRAGARFLEAHKQDLGTRGTVNLEKMFG